VGGTHAVRAGDAPLTVSFFPQIGFLFGFAPAPGKVLNEAR
jgi:hypothetical protein